MICCKKCGYDEDESKIHLHHIVPKSLGGTDLNGRIYLCEKCHHIWHNMLPKIIWDYVPKKERGWALRGLQQKMDWWVNVKTIKS